MLYNKLFIETDSCPDGLLLYIGRGGFIMGFLDILSTLVISAVDHVEKTIEEQQRNNELEIRKYEKRLHEYAKDNPDSEKIEIARRKIEIARQKNSELGVHRRTDAELEMDESGIDKSPSDYQYQKNVRLSEARNIANGMPGVYVLYLDDSVMKCGRAAYKSGVRWRLAQYYNLNYDDRARRGDYWSVTEENRDHIMVSWQCCPVSKCRELEYKLFKKYGKGIWAKRAPQHCDMDTWELLI